MELRIIGGIYKNRSIKIPKKAQIRPTLVRARTIVFDTLCNKLPNNFTFLDAFAGSGIMGIEALSRSAEKVVFFDINKEATTAISSTLKKMEKIPGAYSVICTSVFRPPAGSPVDVIFLDPPYTKFFIIPDIVEKLNKYGWIKSGTYIVAEIPLGEKIQMGEACEWFKTSTISNSMLQFFKYTA